MRGIQILVPAVALLNAMLAIPAVADESDGTGRGVARLSLMGGDVSIRRGDSGDTVAAAVNGPLVVQDRVYTGENSRAEIQFDFANFLRMASNAEVRLAQLENRRYLVQLAAGLTTFTVLRDSQADVEISTPSVSIRPLKRGSYRVMVTPSGETEVLVRSGELEVFTPTGSEKLKSGHMMTVRGSASNPEFQISKAFDQDDWDRWNRNRDRDLEGSVGYRYVSRDIYGIEDLDARGSWYSDPGYGWVWSPRVAVGWAPYRHGRWMWLDWYGWSWVSYDPWGWAPFHYGRWYYGARGWCWYPGGVHVRHYWSPALVAFVGWGHGGGVGIGFGTIGWLPLGPRDPFHRWWGHGIYRGYRDGRYWDNSVHVVNNMNIRNTYWNSRVDNAFTGVDAREFTRGHAGSALRMSDNEWNRASIVQGAVPVRPERESLRMADRSVPAPVRTSFEDRGFYSRRTVAQVDRVPFEEQRAGVERLSRHVSESRNSGFGRSGLPSDAAPVERSNGWRSVNEPGGTGRARVVGEGANPNSGWRTFGEPVRRGDAQVRQPDANTDSDRSGNRGEQNGNGWRSFGDPGTRATPVPGANSGAWRGFGQAGRATEVPSDVQSTNESSGFGRGRVTDRTLDHTGAGRESRNSDGGRATWGGSERSRRSAGSESRREAIEVSPPVVRERSAGFGGGSRSSERMNAPRDSGGNRDGGSSRGFGGGESRGSDRGGSRGDSSGARGSSGGRGAGGRGR